MTVERISCQSQRKWPGIIRSSGNQTLIARVTIQCSTYGANWTVPSLQIAGNLPIYTWISVYLRVDFSNYFMYSQLIHNHVCKIVLFIIKHIMNEHYKIIYVLKCFFSNGRHIWLNNYPSSVPANIITWALQM
jgi:hypothetical protein